MENTTEQHYSDFDLFAGRITYLLASDPILWSYYAEEIDA